jgi:hypothetical protein
MTLQLGDIAAHFPQELALRALKRFLPAERPAVDGFTLLPELFAAQEIGWLAQEGRAALARLSGRPKQGASGAAPAGALPDIDVHEEAFRRLVAHPRLLAPVRERLREPFHVHHTRLIVGRADPLWRLQVEPRQATAAVALTDGALRLDGDSIEATAGSLLLLAPRSHGEVECGDWFFITYDALRNPAGVDSFRSRLLDGVYADDCLWPSPIACAG